MEILNGHRQLIWIRTAFKYFMQMHVELPSTDTEDFLLRFSLCFLIRSPSITLLFTSSQRGVLSLLRLSQCRWWVCFIVLWQFKDHHSLLPGYYALDALYCYYICLYSYCNRHSIYRSLFMLYMFISVIWIHVATYLIVPSFDVSVFVSTWFVHVGYGSWIFVWDSIYSKYFTLISCYKHVSRLHIMSQV